MPVTLKDEQCEAVNQHKRMATGTWVNGEILKEQSKATLDKANSDHGNFAKKTVDKRNA